MTDRFITAAWRKSTHSNGQRNCVEVAPLKATVALRDSKRPDGPVLVVPRSAFHALVQR